ncbi:RNA polymerase sigma factor [Cytobacillus sp. IB215316]|uniref:RNA polymerase sigma factor n=1 Tax=Cytobacillus sp. IB215316 TaxID=3097354 RepID=UPI002A129B2C|nr:RNA polymerase sigma factor [Cytobacillus sp. IB215316]MDX8360921.1 RNA polymerase sigma factor [Cytobacillus sp. IB215316]
MNKRKGISEQQLTEFILEHKQKCYRLAYSYVKNSEDALDIVQESIQKALTSIHTLQDKNSLKSWYYRIVVNTSLDFIRKKKKVSVVDTHTMELISPSKYDNYEQLNLEMIIEYLPDKYKTIIILKYFEDLTLEQVANVLNENVSTIKSRLYKALQLLRIKIDDDYLEEANIDEKTLYQSTRRV